MLYNYHMKIFTSFPKNFFNLLLCLLLLLPYQAVQAACFVNGKEVPCGNFFGNFALVVGGIPLGGKLVVRCSARVHVCMK